MDIDIFPRYRSESNQQFAYRIIKHNILTLRLRPGECLEERELSDVLGMSRTPIREALINLKQEYLVDIYPQKATRVSLIDLALVQDGLFVRSKIEPDIIELLINQHNASLYYALKENLAAQKCAIEDESTYGRFMDLDNDFHREMYIAANKEKIWDCISTISAQYNRIRYFDILWGAARLAPIYELHLRLCEIITTANSDGVDIKDMVASHLSGYQSLLPHLLEEYREYFLQ